MGDQFSQTSIEFPSGWHSNDATLGSESLTNDGQRDDCLMTTETIDRAFDIIRHLRLPEFVFPYRELPSDATAAIESLVDIFADVDEEERKKIVQKVEVSFAFVFTRYAWNAAVESVRRNDPGLLKRGLVALTIENARVDRRDTLPFLELLYNSARKLNVDPAELFRNAARIACAQFRGLLESFLNRDEASRTLEYFHYMESGEGSSFTYVYVEPPSRQPSRKEWKIRMFFRRLRRVLER